MAVMKRGLLIGGAALAGVLALLGIASASTDGGGDGGFQDPYSPEACAAYEAERNSLVPHRNQLLADQSEAEARMQMAADMNDEEALKFWVTRRTEIQNAVFAANRRIAELDDLIAGCQ